MERLTHKARYQAGYKVNRNVHDWECIDKLGQLEDAEEQGLLLKLPCKVGDTVYEINEGRIIEYSLGKNWRILRLLEEGFFGIKVFTSKEEAERALKQMRERKGVHNETNII